MNINQSIFYLYPLLKLRQFLRKLRNYTQYSLDICYILLDSISSALLERSREKYGLLELFQLTLKQIYRIGYESLVLVIPTALGLGSFLIIQSQYLLSKISSMDLLGPFLTVSIVREFAPLITSLIIIARSGTVTTAELGYMNSSHEVQSLLSLGINPNSYLVFPRLMGGIISTITLIVIFCIMALLGGFIVSYFYTQTPFSYYVDVILSSLNTMDLVHLIMKGTGSGIIIFTTCSYHGYIRKISPSEVSIAASKAVTSSMIYILLLYASIFAITYLNLLNRVWL